MRLKRGFLVLFCIVVILGLGFISGKITDLSLYNWYPTLKKSSLNPPSYVFPLAWTALYIMIGLALGLIINKLKKQKKSLKETRYFFLQLFLNFLWTPVFFGLKNPFLGLIVIMLLWGSIIQNIKYYKKISPVASYLLVPYFMWVSFAIYLNLFIYLNN